MCSSDLLVALLQHAGIKHNLLRVATGEVHSGALGGSGGARGDNAGHWSGGLGGAVREGLTISLRGAIDAVRGLAHSGRLARPMYIWSAIGFSSLSLTSPFSSWLFVPHARCRLRSGFRSSQAREELLRLRIQSIGRWVAHGLLARSLGTSGSLRAGRVGGDGERGSGGGRRVPARWSLSAGAIL